MGRGIDPVLCEPPVYVFTYGIMYVYCIYVFMYIYIYMCIYKRKVSLTFISLPIVRFVAVVSSALLYFVFPLHRRVCPPLLSDVASIVVEHDRLLAPSVTAHYYFRDNDEAQHMSLGGSHHLPGSTM